MSTSPAEKVPGGPGLGKKLGVCLVDIYVGPQQEHFRIHKDFLCASVPYFEKMFNGGFKEATEQAASLPEDDPVAFSLFVEWIYTNRLSPLQISEEKIDSSVQIRDRIRLYGFAQKLNIIHLADYLMSNLILAFEHCGKSTDPKNIKLAYEVTPPGSPLRSFVSKYLLHHIGAVKESGKTCENEGAVVGSCVDLATDLISLTNVHIWASQRYLDMTPKSPTTLGLCTFHLHAEGAVCAYKEKIP